MPLPAPKDHYTFADCLTWGENERIEIINGEAVMMAPPSRTHQKISGELFRQIANFLEGKKCEVYAAPFAVRLFEKDGDTPEDVDTIVEPDISVVCDHNKLDKHGCKGAPDLVMEILSPSTMRHDRFTKFNLYQRAGVREYWIVDPCFPMTKPGTNLPGLFFAFLCPCSLCFSPCMALGVSLYTQHIQGLVRPVIPLVFGCIFVSYI